MPVQCNGLCEFSAFFLASFGFWTALSVFLLSLECCHLDLICEAAGVTVLSLFALVVQQFCSILLVQLANALLSVQLCCLCYL